MKIVAALVGAVLALYLFVVNFSAVESKWACQGTFTEPEGEKKGEAFIRLNDYRFWVGLWSDSDGDLWVEVPGRTVEYFSYLKKAGDIYSVSEDKGKGFAGNFSTLSRSLNLQIADKIFFDGSCTPR